MQKSKIESLIRSHVKNNLSPTQVHISLVASIYSSFTDVLGINNCRQIGSFPRYTAVRPLHDLDILYRLGEFKEEYKNPKNILDDLATQIRSSYVNPTKYRVAMSVQTHSISFKFLDGDNEVFAIDIVPAIKRGLNEFGDDTFYVPEIINYRSHKRRQQFYQEIKTKGGAIEWIKTDPLGYINVAANINKINSDFRKSIKFIKGWKNFCKGINDDFKLKSFHLEQIITAQLNTNNSQTLFDIIFECFTNLKSNIEKPRINDRADSEKFIDQYVTELSIYQKSIIHQAIDAVLIALENFDGKVEKLIEAGYYKRVSNEQFLFDFKIPVFEDDSLGFKIDGFIKNFPGFREYTARLSQTGGRIDKKNSIKFQIISNNTSNDSKKWKIKNDDKSVEPRGEIGYENEPVRMETTAYFGKHYVECYAVKDGVCIAKSRVDVII